MELTAHNLTKAYGPVAALRGVSLTAGPGVLALLGPNGAGKSTLLRILATVIRPDAGEVHFGGQPYRADPWPVRRLLGYLPHPLELPPHLTPRRFMHYMARLKGLPPEPQSGALLCALGLGPLADRPAAELSGGQVRRLGIAQALLGSPRLLILDEPTAGLDPEERERAIALVNRPAAGQVVVLSSHLPGEVESIAQRVAVLRRGRLLYAGEVAGLRRLAEGMVHEVTVPAAAVPGWLERYPVSRVAAHGDTAVLRVVGPPPAGLPARPAAPSLEDAYLLLQRSGTGGADEPGRHRVKGESAGLIHIPGRVQDERDQPGLDASPAPGGGGGGGRARGGV